jgi:PTH2 family peptidyl-tRNA hydrolase
MTNEIKQIIVVRNDINMKKGELATQVAAASLKFLIENNESNRNDQVFVTLSNNEASWLTGSFSQVVVGVDSAEQLQDIIIRAELMGVEAHANAKGDTMTCVALGPDESSVLERIIHRLKPI